MSDTKLIKAWGAGCGWSVLIALVIFLVIILVFVGLILLSVLLPVPQDQRIYVWLGGLFVFFIFLLVSMVAWGVFSVGRRTRQLDAAFTPLGLTGKAYLWNGRQYHGTLSGRQVDAYFYRGPHLDIYIASPLNTRLGIGLKGRISQLTSSIFNHPELVTSDPELGKLSIFPLDEAWARELLNVPQARDIILRLLTTEPGYELRNLLFQPEAIHYQLHRIFLKTITPESLHSWVYDLLDLARIAESLPLPAITATASPMERTNRLSRGDLSMPILAISCALIGFFMTLLVVIVIIVLSLSRSGI